jgi:hypothetical protein
MKIRSIVSSLVVGGLVLFGANAPAQADIALLVYPSSAPNVFGSPSWNAYNTNALASIHGNLGNIGDRNTDPTAYEVAGAIIDPGDVTVAGFSSWRGVAGPAAPFTGEYGNRLHFGLRVVGGGDNPQFRLNDLAFNMSSGDSFNSLAFVGDFVGLNYSATRYGIDYGADRMLGGGDDTVYTTGNGLSLVDEIVYVGVGNAFDATFEAGATDQDKLNSAMAYIYGEGPFDISCVYTINDPNGGFLASGGGSVIVPAPGAVALLGLAGLVAPRRRRAA